MVKLIILYYLNIKSTHGYEIQKFIQATGLDVWAKVKSGSIYYALSKMEEKGEIELEKEEMHDSKVRKIYSITEKGRKELEKCIQKELAKPLIPIGTDKFILPITLNRLEKEKAVKIINNHIKGLEETLEYWQYWKDMKVNKSTLNVDRLSFDMTIEGIKNSIKWHKELINEYDEYKEYSKNHEEMIRNIDFENIKDVKSNDELDKKRIEELKDIIISEPDKAKEALEELVFLMKKE